MGRILSTAVAAASTAVFMAGCGATTVATDSSGVRLTVKRTDAAPAKPVVLDGRLGDATVTRSGSPLRELSPGGRLDLRRRGSGRRRDGVGAGAACANPNLTPTAASLPAVVQATLCLLNGERADHGLAPLVPNAKLAATAGAYAQDLVAGSYFSHTGRDGSGVLDRIERSGYIPADAGYILGENLAWGTGTLATPGAIMTAWMNSPGHRENILMPDYREIGIGVVVGNPAAPDGLGATYATEFGAIEGIEDYYEDEADEPAAVTEPAAPAPHAGKKPRKRTRRHRRARHARHARHVRRAGKGRGRHRKAGRVQARGPIARIAL